MFFRTRNDFSQIPNIFSICKCTLFMSKLESQTLEVTFVSFKEQVEGMPTRSHTKIRKKLFFASHPQRFRIQPVKGLFLSSLIGGVAANWWHPVAASWIESDLGQFSFSFF